MGKTDSQIIDAIYEANLKDNLENMGYQPHNIAVKAQKEASVLILPLRREPEYKSVLPGKLFEYLASLRPILGIGQPDGAMSMILQQVKAGVVINWEERSEISRFIDICWEKHLKGELMDNAADISQFTRFNISRKMADLFDNTVS